MLIQITHSFISLVKNPRSAIDIRNRPGIPIPDEDPYSIAGSGSSGGSSGNGNGVRDRERSRPNKEPRPPELPPRDGGQYGTKSSRVKYLNSNSDIIGLRYSSLIQNVK